MTPKIIENNLIKEKYFYMSHPSGLDIYIHPKKNYKSNYAIFGTKFGSINNKFKLDNEESYTIVPDGIAHYLEHKLFENKEGDAFSLFAKTGASANAYTSFEKTAYLFSCTENFESSLEILLNFVQSPYFTEENVKKEQGIIGQEIKMYEDSPDWKILINLLGALYKNHPVKIDIAGSVESIAKITPETLYKCYDAFYNLNNMVLCIVGDVEPDKIFSIVNKNLKNRPAVKVEKYYPDEPVEVVKDTVTEKFDIQTSSFCLGFKEKMDSGEIRTCKELAYTDIILKCIASKTSEMYQDLLNQGLINTSSFATEYFEGPGYASIIFSGESPNPKKTAEIIRNYADKIKKSGIDKETFERSKKAIYGQNLSAFNSVSDIANLSLAFALSGREIFEYINEIENANFDEISKELSKHLDSKYSALSIVEPKND